MPCCETQPRIAPVEPGDEKLGLADRRKDVSGGLRQVLRDRLLVRQVRADLHFEIGAQRRLRRYPTFSDQPEAGRGDDVVNVADGVALAVVAVEQRAVDLPR